MPEPQIARRCASCGVSIRLPASFCPECGKALTLKRDAASEADATEPLRGGSGTPELTADTFSSAATMPLDSDLPAGHSRNEKAVAPPTALPTPPFAPRKRPMQATVGMVHRAEAPQREAIGEDGLNRVEKFRQISSAVIDEAAYDPSLRFVLVAAVLFALFLVLLLLSELIT